MARTYGMLQGWHNISTSPSAPANFGFSWINDLSPEAPLSLIDGQMTWLTTTFSSDQLKHTGTIELGMTGKSTVALVFLNGHWLGVWASDEASLAQGLHSELLQGVGTRQLMADLDYAHFFSTSSSRIPLPSHLLNNSGGQDNRVTCLLLDISPPLDADLVLPLLGTVSGQGLVTEFALYWNREDPLFDKPEDDAVVAWSDIVFELQEEPPPPEE